MSHERLLQVRVEDVAAARRAQYVLRRINGVQRVIDLGEAPKQKFKLDTLGRKRRIREVGELPLVERWATPQEAQLLLGTDYWPLVESGKLQVFQITPVTKRIKGADIQGILDQRKKERGPRSKKV